LSLALVGQPTIRQCALDLLARREHSQQELSTKLQSRGYENTAISLLLAELATTNLQSDQRFAEAYTQRRTNKGFGPLCIQAELQQRGIAGEIIQDLIIVNDEFWLEQAKKVRQKKFGALIPKDFKTQVRQMRFLQSRGFSGAQIKQLLQNRFYD
jgi:regulatory protein